MPAISIRKLVVVVIGSGKTTRPGDRYRCDRVATGEQVHIRGAMLQRDSGRIEGGGRRADHTHRLATQSGEVDCILGMCVAGGRQMRGQDVRNDPAAGARKACRENDLSGCLDHRTSRRVEMDFEMIARGLDPVQACPVTRVDAEKTLVPAEIIGPVRALYPVDGSVCLLSVTGLVPCLKAECRECRVPVRAASSACAEGSSAPR